MESRAATGQAAHLRQHQRQAARQADLAEQVQGISARQGPTLPCCCWSFPPSPESSGCGYRAHLTRMRTMGVRLSLDDFGGSSNMQEALQQLPLNQLKLSHSLVQRLGPNNAAEAAVQAAIALAARHQMTIVGAGVETLEQRALLAQHGCEHFMGYLLSPLHRSANSNRCCSGRQYPVCRKLQLDLHVSAMKKGFATKPFSIQPLIDKRYSYQSRSSQTQYSCRLTQ
jgi:hypothetical protein